jgi:hypothetical protein
MCVITHLGPTLPNWGYAHFREPCKAEVQLPHTRVNRPPFELVIRWLIRDSSSCVPLLGVSATRLDNASLQASHLKERRLHTVVGLLAEGLGVVLVMALGWWGMMTLGSHSLASESDSLTAERDPIYVGGCRVPAPLQKSPARGGVGEGRGCTEEGSSHPITPRQPGVGLGGRGHGAERQRNDRVPPRTSEKGPSTHSGE